jgi:hypothetical protein
LPLSEQKRIAAIGSRIGRYALERTRAVIVAPPPSEGADVNNGSAFVLALHGTRYLCTAAHIPPEGVQLGGMSGGPAFLLGELAYPVVGLVSQHNAGFEIMRIASLASAKVPSGSVGHPSKRQMAEG